MERLSLLKTPSDSLALVEIPHHPFRPDTAQRELVLALDQVQNPGNLGTIIRLADWFGIPEIVCSPTTADCYNPKVVQATMGAILRVKVHYTALEPYLAQARERNIPVYGTFLEGKHLLDTPYAGRDRPDGQRRPRDRSGRRTTRIAQTVHPPYPADRNGSESLNVAIATAVVCAEFAGRRAQRDKTSPKDERTGPESRHSAGKSPSGAFFSLATFISSANDFGKNGK